MEALRQRVDGVNEYIGRSTFGRMFRLEHCGHVRTVYNVR